MTNGVYTLELNSEGSVVRLTDLLAIEERSVDAGPLYAGHVVHCVDGTRTKDDCKTGIQCCLFHEADLVASCEIRTHYYGHWVHPHAAVTQDQQLIVAAGNSVCSLSLPSFRLSWLHKVDLAQCLGVHLGSSENVICHGECAISNVALSGKLGWSFSGPDVFSGGFECKDGIVRAVDFDGHEFIIDEATGKIAV